MRWRNVSRTACSLLAALAASGCGGSSSRLPVLTAVQLAGIAQEVADGHGCGGGLVAASVAAVNRREVPASLQEDLLSAANEIAATCSRARARELARQLAP